MTDAPSPEGFRLGDVAIAHPYTMAAMSGYSDWPMRVLARRYGASYTVHEVLLDRYVRDVRDPASVARHLTVCDEERPVAAQLMGSDVETFRAAADRLICSGFDAIDINFGCPIRTAKGGCRGGYHLADPDHALVIVREVLDVAVGRVPVTVKLRAGLDATAASEAKFFEILHGALACGAAGVTVHARTVVQRYEGPSHWPLLARVKAAVGDAVVLGSGDLFDAPACHRMLTETGVDGVAVARGALGNPWIFGACLAAPGTAQPPPSIREQAAALQAHRQLCIDRVGAERAVRPMRRFAVKCARHHPEHHKLRRSFGTAKTQDAWDHVLDTFYGTGIRAAG